MAAIGCRIIPYVLHEWGVPISFDVSIYPWNFSPMLPLCIFGAACFHSLRSAFLVPLGIYLVSDLAIWLVTGNAEWAFYSGQGATYVSLLLVIATGLVLRNRRGWTRIAAAGLAGSITFFLVSNLGVWAFGGGQRYALTAAGLIDCYVQAIPFFRNTLISMLVFLPILFSPMVLRESQADGRLRAA